MNTLFPPAVGSYIQPRSCTVLMLCCGALVLKKESFNDLCSASQGWAYPLSSGGGSHTKPLLSACPLIISWHFLPLSFVQFWSPHSSSTLHSVYLWRVTICNPPWNPSLQGSQNLNSSATLTSYMWIAMLCLLPSNLSCIGSLMWGGAPGVTAFPQLVRSVFPLTAGPMWFRGMVCIITIAGEWVVVAGALSPDPTGLNILQLTWTGEGGWGKIILFDVFVLFPGIFRVPIN